MDASGSRAISRKPPKVSVYALCIHTSPASEKPSSVWIFGGLWARPRCRVRSSSS
jgi:hypothetical protein